MSSVQEVIQRLAYRTIPRDLDPGSRVPHETTRAMNVDRAALHGRAILIKTARTPTVNDERREQLFRSVLNVVEIGVELRHRNVAQVQGIVWNPEHVPGIVYPCLEDMRTYVRRMTPGVDLLYIASGIISGLAFLHGRRSPVVHGGLRCERIAVTPEGVPIIMDIAMYLIPCPSGVPDDGGVRWRAPELLAPLDNESDDTHDSARATTRSDVHSLGMTLYELFTGHAPFAHLRSAQVVVLVSQGSRPPRRPHFTNELWALLEGCWHHDPRQRLDAKTAKAQLSAMQQTS